MSLEVLEKLALAKIRDFYTLKKGKVYVAYSGGRDSTVMLHLVRRIYPDVEAVFIDTGFEYPEIKKTAKETENVTVLKPKMSFIEIINKYGYPVISKEQSYFIYQVRTTHSQKVMDMRLNGVGPKHRFKIAEKWKFLIEAPFKISNKCCDITKKAPFKRYEKETGNFPFIGLMQSDSYNRKFLIERSCSNYYMVNKEYPIFNWCTQNVIDYLKKYKISYCPIYDTGVKHTGCMYCLYGCHLEPSPNRFQIMKNTHPQIYNYCINKLGIGEVLDYIGVEY